ncbi:hypothetical protein GDO78_008526 [Eleutherodactylus coqui]|uniref:Protein Mdm4 n=1 Tax=Eleutherodactylus coqui TaxID=57060 RepID=A0A8J6FF63_ELECQ|nr:hypothetical protein GDO78_008526 [Eleutherodactylus coqui]
MSTSTSSQQLLGLDPSNRDMQDSEGDAVRPQPDLLKLLHTAGAKGDTFTLKQVMYFLGQYIMVKQLYDKQQQHIVHCGTDELGKLLGITTFSVKDPSPLYEMLKKNLHKISCTDAAQSPSRDQTQATGGLERRKDIDTALVSDTTDDLWFLNDSRSDQINVEVKVESMDSKDGEDEEAKDEGKKVLELTVNGDDLEDTQSLSDTDTEIESEDSWQCANCHKFNSPSKRYCFRCWALRKDWYADYPKLTHTLSTPTLPAKVSSQESNGIDIPDCRRTVSAPMVRLRNNDKFKVPFLEPLDLASNVRTLSESTETLLSSEEASLESSRPLLELCRLCHRRPRNGNIVHGRTAHLVTCFLCACNLKKTRQGCLVCQKPIQMVVKTYVA